MERKEILEILKGVLAEIMDIDTANISEADSLKALGANSIDRADIIVTTIEECNVKIPMMKFSDAKNIGGIIDVILENM